MNEEHAGPAGLLAATVTTRWHDVRQTIVLRDLVLFEPPRGPTGAAPNDVDLLR